MAGCVAWKDDITECLASFAIDSADTTDAYLLHGAKRILVDTLAVGLGAFHHPAAIRARDYLKFFSCDPSGAVIWGTPLRVAPDKATLVNGVLLRCYDFNDVMIGKSGAGHPSDMISALVSVCDWRRISGNKLLQAIVVGYEVAEALHDIVGAEAAGFDHANVSALGATCAVGRLLGLNIDEMGEALGISAIQHIQSNEIESSALNKRGDLTMWKRFHGADAMRHALDSCLLAAAGAESAVRPFRGRLGFLSAFGVREDPGPYLRDRLQPGLMTGSVNRTNFKRWPVGSRAQSAIASALSARGKVPAGAQISAVNVQTEPGVYEHLVGIRTDPWRPISRETADHSLPYIVGVAVLDGYVNVGSFDLEKVLDPQRGAFIAKNVSIKIEGNLDSVQSGDARHLSQVEIVTDDGARFTSDVMPAPGHRGNPFSVDDLLQKMHENGDALIGAQKVNALFAAIDEIEYCESVREVATLLAVA